MAYATAAEFGGAQGYLGQVDITDADTLVIVNDILARATAVVDRVLGFSFEGFTDGTDKTLRGPYGAYFNIPPHDIGTVTAVTTIGGTDLDGYWEETESGLLYAVDSYGNEGDWRSARYVVTADWGFGEVPDDVKEVALELAVNIWRGKDSGQFSNVIGVPGGGAVGYEGALTPRQKMILEDVKDAMYPGVVV